MTSIIRTFFGCKSGDDDEGNAPDDNQDSTQRSAGDDESDDDLLDDAEDETPEEEEERLRREAAAFHNREVTEKGEDQKDEVTDEVEPRRPQARIRPRNVEELFSQAIPERARGATANLKQHLTGKVLFELKPSEKKYIVDWSGQDVVCKESKDGEAICSIRVSEADLMRIANGDLNPQIAMLSHKVTVSGDTNHAIYVFNLIAPSVNAF